MAEWFKLGGRAGVVRVLVDVKAAFPVFNGSDGAVHICRVRTFLQQLLLGLGNAPHTQWG